MAEVKIALWSRATAIVAGMDGIGDLTTIEQGVVVGVLVHWIEAGHSTRNFLTIWGDRPLECARDTMHVVMQARAQR